MLLLRLYLFMNSSAETFSFCLAHFSRLGKKQKADSIEPFLSWQICPSLLLTAAIYNISAACVWCYYDNQGYNIGTEPSWTSSLKTLTGTTSRPSPFRGRDRSWSLWASVSISTVRSVSSVFCPVLPNYPHVSTPASHCSLITLQV